MLSLWRIVLGLGVALLVALSFRFCPSSTAMIKARTPQGLSYEEIVLESAKPKYINKKRLLIHMEKEFSQLLFYFSMAAGVLSVVKYMANHGYFRQVLHYQTSPPFQSY